MSSIFSKCLVVIHGLYMGFEQFFGFSFRHKSKVSQQLLYDLSSSMQPTKLGIRGVVLDRCGEIWQMTFTCWPETNTTATLAAVLEGHWNLF